MQTERLIARIRGQLEVGTPDLEARSLAGEYAALCQRTRERLEQCAALIKAGNDHAALQVAESEPDLLGLCAQLSFADSERWQALCRERGLPTGFPLDDHHILAVESLYGKVIGENHPLYRDYREAMRQRDEDRALTVLRSIARINPDDPTARSELTRLSSKFLRESLGKVLQFFDQGSAQEAVELMNRMERFGALALTNEPRWDDALARRLAHLRDKAHEQILRLLPEARAARESAQWETCASHLGRIRTWERDHQVTLTPTDLEELSSLEAWAGELAAVAEAEATQRSALETLTKEWDLLRQDAARGSSPALLISRLNVWIEKATPLTDRLPEGTVREARGVRQLTRARLSRRYTILTTSWVAGLLCLLLGAYWWQAQEGKAREANDRFTEIQALVERWDNEGAVRKLEKLKEDHPLFVAGEEIKAATEALQRQAVAQADTELQLKTEATYLEQRRKEGINLTNFAPVTQRAKAYVSELAKVGPAASARLQTVLPNPEAVLATCTKVSEESRNDLLALRRQLKVALGEDETVVNLPRANEALEKLRTLLTTLSAAGLKDLDEAYAEADRAALRLEADQKSVNAVRGLADSGDLKAYLDALAAVAQTAKENSDLRRRASFIAERAEALRNLPRSTLAPRVGAMWDGLVKSDPNGIFQPDELLASEDKVIRALADDKTTARLRKYNVRQHSSGGDPRIMRQVFIAGEISLQRNLISGGIETVRTAKELTREGTVVESSWSCREFNKPNGETTKSGEDLLEGLVIPELDYLRQFTRFYDLKAGKMSEPLLRKLDLIRRSPTPHLELRAFQMQELFKIASQRPEAWGLLYSPSAQRDAEQLRRITQNAMSPYDFLFKDKWADVQPELRAFLTRQTGATYAEEARFWRRTLGELQSKKLMFAGTMGRDGKPALREVLTNSALYGLDSEGKPALLFRTDTAGSLIRVNEPALLTPLLRLSGTVTEAAQAAGIPAGLTPPNGGWESILQGRDL
jgi:hypothetical protein